MDNLTAARAFVRVVETGSFAKAADSLHLPRNTVTKLVQFLEAHLRTRLLNRTTRRVSPTSDGVAYFQRIAPLLEQWAEVEDDMASARSHPRGRLRVDMSTSIATLLLMPTLADFHARYPDVQLDIGASDRMVDLVGERVDCVIRGGAVTDPALIARHLGTLPRMTVASPEYLAARGTPSHPEELGHSHTLIRQMYGGTSRPIPIELTNEGETAKVAGKHFVSLDDSNAMLAAALQGLGVMHCPAFTVGRHVESGGLVELMPEWRSAPIALYIVYAANRHLSARVRVFVDWMIALFADHPYTTPPERPPAPASLQGAAG